MFKRNKDFSNSNDTKSTQKGATGKEDRDPYNFTFKAQV
jgi:hypothetical protein